MKLVGATIALLALVTTTLGGAAGAADVDKSYDAVKSMHFHLQC